MGCPASVDHARKLPLAVTDVPPAAATTRTARFLISCSGSQTGRASLPVGFVCSAPIDAGTALDQRLRICLFWKRPRHNRAGNHRVPSFFAISANSLLREGPDWVHSLGSLRMNFFLQNEEGGIDPQGGPKCRLGQPTELLGGRVAPRVSSSCPRSFAWPSPFTHTAPLLPSAPHRYPLPP